MPFSYDPDYNVVLHELRRKVVEAEVTAKGLTPGTSKHREVVERQLRKVKYHQTSKYDDKIPPIDLAYARQGRRRPEKHRVSKQRKRA